MQRRAHEENARRPRLRAAPIPPGFRRALAACALAVSCAAKPLPIPPPEISPTLYRVHHPDHLLVQITPEPELEVEATVRPDGMISIVLIGDVRAEGLTTEEIARQIEGVMGEYRLFPVVTVSVLEARSSTITVAGEVGKPGRIPLERDTRLAEAIAMAGGATELAAASRVRLVRRDGEVTRTYIVDLDEIHEGDNSTNALLQSGDLIMVPPAKPVGVGYALRRVLYPFEVVLSTLFRAVFWFV